MLSLGCELKFNFLVLKFLGIEQYLEFLYKCYQLFSKNLSLSIDLFLVIMPSKDCFKFKIKRSTLFLGEFDFLFS